LKHKQKGDNLVSSSQNSDIKQIIDLFEEALRKLNYDVEPLVVEKWSLVVHRAMDGGGRSYHGPSHILHLAQGSGPFIVLAAIYHDIVQVSVDRGTGPEISNLFGPYIRIKDGDYLLKEIDQEKDRIAYFVSRIFGFGSQEKKILASGRNEFLSSLVCVSELRKYLSEKDLITICACIEATIPFRDAKLLGKDALLILKDRIDALNEEFQLGFEEKDIDKIIFYATDLANKDVDNFSEILVENFIDNTWNILPEGSPAMRYPNTLKIKDFRKALEGMEIFLSGLKIELIFSSYKNNPTQEELEELLGRTKINIEIALRYLRIRIYSIALLDAIAEETGGDTSLSLFMGDLVNNGVKNSLEDFLPLEGEFRNSKNLDPLILNLLTVGYRGNLKYETSSCLYTSIVYRILGEEKILKSFILAKEFFCQKVGSQEFLKSQDSFLTHSIIQSLLKLAPTREKALLKLQNTLNT
jgi:hypothetical protein